MILIEEREDGWYAIFLNGKKFGPQPTEADLMFFIMRLFMDEMVEMMGNNYPCPRCGKIVAGEEGYLLEIDGAPTFFCSEECAYKRRVFPRNFQKEMV